ncbi:hypothetical protein Tco_0598332 [Tanacetum coccineum]
MDKKGLWEVEYFAPRSCDVWKHKFVGDLATTVPTSHWLLLNCKKAKRVNHVRQNYERFDNGTEGCFMATLQTADTRVKEE